MTERVVAIIAAAAGGLELGHAAWVLGIALLVLAMCLNEGGADHAA